MSLTRRQLVSTSAAALLVAGIAPISAVAAGPLTSIPESKLVDAQFPAQSLSHCSIVNYELPNAHGKTYIRAMARKRKQTFYAALAYHRNGKVTLQIEKRVYGLTVTKFKALEINQEISQVSLALSARGRKETKLTATLTDRQTGNQWKLDAIDTDAPLYSEEHYNYGHSLYATEAQELYNFSNTVTYFDYSTSQATLARWGTPVFEDNFRSYDESKWRIRDNDCLSYDRGWISKEAVQFTSNGLAISWLPRETPRRTSDGLDRKVNTGYIDTIGKFSQEYGRWEARMRFPAGRGESQGLWGGIWLRPDNTALGTEIDIAECYGEKSETSTAKVDSTETAEATLHFDQTGKNKSNKMPPRTDRSLQDEWHVWAVEKTPDAVRFFLDDEQYHEVLRSSDPAKFDSAFPKGALFNIRLNTQAGNKFWGYIPDNADYLPATLKVDYVKVWSYSK